MATELDRLIVRLEANLDQFDRELRRAETRTNRSARRMASAFQRADAATGRLTRGIFNVRNALAAGFGGLALRQVLQEFGDFDAGLIGVGKTTDLAGGALQDLGSDIQALARRVPEATTTLLQIAQSAGQLGVQGSENILKFTEVIGKLGGATNLQGEAAASTLARLINITGESVGNVDRLGAAIVDLGNNFAATEGEIADVALRVARGTAPFGVSVQDILGISTALRAVGVEAEAGGSVILRAFQQINKGLQQGGKELNALVAITGQSAEQLRESFGEDATEAFVDFIEAAGRIEASELPAFLEELGLDGVRAAGILQALAGNADLLTRAIETSNRAWMENSALNEEARRAAEGFNAQMQLTRNAMSEAAVALGSELGPVIVELAQDLRDFIAAAKESGDLADVAQSAGEAARFLARNIDTLAIAFGGLFALRGATKLGLLLAQMTPLGRAATLAAAGVGALALSSEEAAARVGDLTLDVGNLFSRLVNAPARLQDAFGRLNDDINTVRDNINSFLNEEITSATGISPETLRSIVNPLDVIIERGNRVSETFRRIQNEAAFGGPPSPLRGPGGGGAAFAIGPGREERELAGLVARADQERQGRGGRGGGPTVAPSDTTQQKARENLEGSIRALEDEARIASTVAGQRDELRTILALENAARAANITLTGEQLDRARAAIQITQQHAREEELLQRVRATEVDLSDDIQDLRLRLRFAGEETEEFRILQRLLEIRRDIEAEITPEMEAQVRAAERLRSLSDELTRIRETNVTVTEELTSSTLNLERAGGQFGQTVTSGFEDAIVAGESFSDTLDGLEDDLLRLGTRLLVLEPIEGGLRTGIGAFQPPDEGSGPGGLEGAIGGGLTGLANLFPSPVAPLPQLSPSIPGIAGSGGQPFLGLGLADFNRIDPLARQDVGSEELEAIFGSLTGAGEEAAAGIELLGAAGGAAGGTLEGTLAPAALEAATETLTETAATVTATTALTALATAATEAAVALTAAAAAATASSAGTVAGGGPDIVSSIFAVGGGTPFEAGGSVSGPGTGISDSIPAMLSDGEFVVNARMAQRHRGVLEAINDGRFSGPRRLAEGGFVMPPQIPQGSARPTASAAPPDSSIGLRPIIMNITTQSSVSEIHRNVPQLSGALREAISRAEKRDD